MNASFAGRLAVVDGHTVWTGARDTCGVGVWQTPPELRRDYGAGRHPAYLWVEAWRQGCDHPLDIDPNLVPSCGNPLCATEGHAVRRAVPEVEVVAEPEPPAVEQPPAVQRVARTTSTHCFRGHPYAEHGYLRTDGYYQCRVCHGVSNRKWRPGYRKVRRENLDACAFGHGPEHHRVGNGATAVRYCAECRRLGVLNRMSAEDFAAISRQRWGTKGVS